MTDVNMPGESTILMIGQTPVQPPLGAKGNGAESVAADPAAAAAEGTAQQPVPSFLDGGLMPIIILFVLMMFGMTFLTSRKEKKRRKEMLSKLDKKASVQTIGGIMGSVIEVKGDLVVLEVDKSSNTRMTFSRSAIQTVHQAGDGDATS